MPAPASSSATNAIVFVGPSLPPGRRPAGAGIDWRGPAACGDLLAAARTGVRAIGLIDGVFEAGRSVWHKEILWALDHGVTVCGTASMGALRAAELWPLGMVGIGDIFAQYRDGTLEDDDEVAVLHGPAEAGHAPVTEAMVSLRATLADAAAAGILTPPEAAALTAAAKTLFYKDRTTAAVLDHCRALGWPAARTAAVAAWLKANRRDLKQQDALALVAWITEAAPAPAAAPARLVRTRFWDDLAQGIAAREATRTPGPAG